MGGSRLGVEMREAGCHGKFKTWFGDERGGNHRKKKVARGEYIHVNITLRLFSIQVTFPSHQTRAGRYANTQTMDGLIPVGDGLHQAWFHPARRVGVANLDFTGGSWRTLPRYLKGRKKLNGN